MDKIIPSETGAYDLRDGKLRYFYPHIFHPSFEPHGLGQACIEKLARQYNVAQEDLDDILFTFRKMTNPRTNYCGQLIRSSDNHFNDGKGVQIWNARMPTRLDKNYDRLKEIVDELYAKMQAAGFKDIQMRNFDFKTNMSRNIEKGKRSASAASNDSEEDIQPRKRKTTGIHSPFTSTMFPVKGSNSSTSNSPVKSFSPNKPGIADFSSMLHGIKSDLLSTSEKESGKTPRFKKISCEEEDDISTNYLTEDEVEIITSEESVIYGTHTLAEHFRREGTLLKLVTGKKPENKEENLRRCADILVYNIEHCIGQIIGNEELHSKLMEARKLLLDKEETEEKIKQALTCLAIHQIFDSVWFNRKNIEVLCPKKLRLLKYRRLLLDRTQLHSLPPFQHMSLVFEKLAGTGDHNFWRRRILMAKPLAADGVGSILLENPFYGSRKPKDQLRSCLRNVTDLFVMGGCLMLECSVLLNWCEENGYGPLAIHGISMGGHMASLAATYWPKPVALIPCLSWSTASCVFTQGVMSGALPWNLLKNQFYGLKDLIIGALSDTENEYQTDAFRCGRHFGLNFPDSVDRLEELQNERRHSEIPYQSGLPRFLRRKHASYTDVVEFMRGVMDQFTHLGNYSVPVDSSLVIVVAAAKDAYIPRHGVTSISELWPAAEIRYIPHSGHVQAALFYQDFFRRSILDALNRCTNKYYQS